MPPIVKFINTILFIYKIIATLLISYIFIVSYIILANDTRFITSEFMNRLSVVSFIFSLPGLLSLIFTFLRPIKTKRKEIYLIGKCPCCSNESEIKYSEK